jgi:methionyl-tRNA formyltransferase
MSKMASGWRRNWPAIAPARGCWPSALRPSYRHGCSIASPAPYNIHPGPPSYPGRHPESWGAYDGVAKFGATFHAMAPRVDEGAIVDVEWVDVPPGSGQMDVGMRAFRAALGRMSRWAQRLLTDEAPLPANGLAWSGRKTSHAQLEEMCVVTPDIDPAEFERRRRAFAEQEGSRMRLVLHGREFHYTAPPFAIDGEK